jgi:hypothetical protein
VRHPDTPVEVAARLFIPAIPAIPALAPRVPGHSFGIGQVFPTGHPHIGFRRGHLAPRSSNPQRMLRREVVEFGCGVSVYQP